MKQLPRRGTRRTGAMIAAGAATVCLAACGGGNPLQSSSNAGGSGSAAGGGRNAVTVGSADFTEDQVLAKIYVKALEEHGVKVTERPDIGSREVYIKALKDHSIDMIPEYTGNLLDYFTPHHQSKVAAPKKVYRALQKATPGKLEVLEMASAQDKDTLTVTRQTASKYHLKSYADLKGPASKLVLVAPPEFKTRYAGSVGLRKLYGVSFQRLKGVSSAPLKVKALTSGEAQVGDIFSTNPQISRKHLVTLKDPKNLFTAQNVVPLIRKSKASPKVAKVLNAVTAKLTTRNLTAAVAKVEVDKANPKKVAATFVSEHHLG